MNTTFSVRIFDTTANLRFSLVEKTVWHGANINAGTWSSDGSIERLTIASGTSGALRFKSDVTGDTFLVALGIHFNQRWCHAHVGLTPDQTAMEIHPQYHDPAGGPLGGVLMNPAARMKARIQGGNYRKVVVEFVGPTVVNIIIY